MKANLARFTVTVAAGADGGHFGVAPGALVAAVLSSRPGTRSY